MEAPEDQTTAAADDAQSEPPRLPPMGRLGVYGGQPPLHTLPYAIEKNVSRIAAQIAEGRPATYD